MTVPHSPSDGVVVQTPVPSSDVVRVRLGDVDGLRALAIAAIVTAVVLRSVGLPNDVAPTLARLAADTGQGLALFVAISAFALAYPALAAMRADGAAYLDVGRYAFKRILRVLPALLAVIVAAAALHPIAGLMHLPALARAAPAIDPRAFVRDALGFGNAAGNDGIRAVGLFLRCYVLFPIALALWARAPRVTIALAIAAGAADVATAVGHAWSIGAIVPLVLGIAAADLRVRNDRLQRFGLPLAAIAAALAFVLEPRVAGLAGTVAAPDALRVDPLWSLAWFGLIAGVGAARILARIAAFAPFRLLGAASYAISLVAIPVAAFAVRQAPASLGRPASAAAATAAVLVAGFALWQIVDRWFSGDRLRRALADRPGAIVNRILRVVRLARVTLGSPSVVGAMPEPDLERPDPVVAFYAPPPRPVTADLAVLSTRTGSADDLAAEIIETKRRLTERNAAFFAPEPQPDPEPDAIEEAESGAERFAKPGFYRRPPAGSRSAPKPVTPTVPVAPGRTAIPLPPAPIPAPRASDAPSVPAAAVPMSGAIEQVPPPSTAAAERATAESGAPPSAPPSSDFAAILPPAPAVPEPDVAAPVGRGRVKPSLLQRVAKHARRNGTTGGPVGEPEPVAATERSSPAAEDALDSRDPSDAAAAEPVVAETAGEAAAPLPIEPAAPVRRPPITMRIGPGRDVPSPTHD